VTKNNQVRHHYIVQKYVDGHKSFGLHVSKSECIFAKSLGKLLGDPRITAAFYLSHPVNKVSSFLQTHSDRPVELGYASHWEYGDIEEEESHSDPSSGKGTPSDIADVSSGTMSPPSVDLEFGPPRPRTKRGPIPK
jgi:hypothetical protein